jgi:hypothetical protein
VRHREFYWRDAATTVPLCVDGDSLSQGNIFVLEGGGATTSISMPKGKASLGLFHPYLVLQVFVPPVRHGTQRTKRPCPQSSPHRSPARTDPLHRPTATRAKPSRSRWW